MIESMPLWQPASLVGVLAWVLLSSLLNLSLKIRIFLQPWATRHVISGIPFILQIQKFQHPYLDCLFSVLSCVVSVPFYTAFLPLLFWSGHGKLARQMTFLMAFCDYVGNCIKDVLSAPRPSSPPVRRFTATRDEKENALEYGLPSSHTLNTVCLCGYLFHYALSHSQPECVSTEIAGILIVCIVVSLVGLGRIYLGMHCLVDVMSGLAIGISLLSVWVAVDEYVDKFVISGPNLVSYWTALSLLLLLAYPTPELPTPSFEYHTAFSGVTLGIAIGVRQTYHEFHHEKIAQVFTPQLPLPTFVGRMLVGIPVILVVKLCSKILAKWALPIVSHMLGIPISSTAYIQALNSSISGEKHDVDEKRNRVLGIFLFSQKSSFDVDTGIRFLQYAGLAWSVVDLVPTMFLHFGF